MLSVCVFACNLLISVSASQRHEVDQTLDAAGVLASLYIERNISVHQSFVVVPIPVRPASYYHQETLNSSGLQQPVQSQTQAPCRKRKRPDVESERKEKLARKKAKKRYDADTALYRLARVCALKLRVERQERDYETLHSRLSLVVQVLKALAQRAMLQENVFVHTIHSKHPCTRDQVIHMGYRLENYKLAEKNILNNLFRVFAPNVDTDGLLTIQVVQIFTLKLASMAFLLFDALPSVLYENDTVHL